MDALYDYFTYSEVDEDLFYTDEGIIALTNCGHNDEGEFQCEYILEEDRPVLAAKAEQQGILKPFSVFSEINLNSHVPIQDEEVDDQDIPDKTIQLYFDDDEDFISKVGNSVLNDKLDDNGITDLGDYIWNVFDLEFIGFDPMDDGDIEYFYEVFGDTYSIDESPSHHMQVKDEMDKEYTINWQFQVFMVFMFSFVLVMLIPAMSSCRRRVRSFDEQKKSLLNVGFQSNLNGENTENHECTQGVGSYAPPSPDVVENILVDEREHKEQYILFI